MALSPEELVWNLPLSTRAQNGFKGAGIATVSELLRLTEGDLQEIPRFGRKTIGEIKALLQKEGLSLGMSPADIAALWNKSVVAKNEVADKGVSRVVVETVDDEIVRVLKAAVDAKHHQIILHRCGWLGREVLTLEEIARNPDLSGLKNAVTRERIRQIQSKAERRIRSFWALNRPEAIISAISLLEDVSPIAKKDVRGRLVRAGCVQSPLCYEGLRLAAKLAKLRWGFLELFRDDPVIVKASAYSPESLWRVEGAILGAIQGAPFASLTDVVKRAGNRICANYVSSIINAHPGLYWLDEMRSCFWRKPCSSPNANKIIFVCGKLFSLKREVLLSELISAVDRARTVDVSPSAEVLKNLLVQSGLFEPEGNRVIAREGVEFDNLNETDRKVLRAARSLGQTVQFLDLRNNLVHEGLSSNAANVQIQVSPLLVKVARGKYRVVVDPRNVDERLLADSGEKQREAGFSDEVIVHVKVGAKEKLTGNIIVADIPDAKWLVVSAQEFNSLECESRNGKLIGLKALFVSLGVIVGDALKLVFDFESGKVSVFVTNEPLK